MNDDIYRQWEAADEADAAGREAEWRQCEDEEVASPFWLRYRPGGPLFAIGDVTDVTVEQPNNFGKVTS
jgi:hypothetical protein